MPLGAKYYDYSVASQKTKTIYIWITEEKKNWRHEKEAKNTTLCLKLDIRWKMSAK